MKKILTILLSFVSLTVFAEGVAIGYTNGTVDRAKVFHLGTATRQGQAIRLSAEKLKALKGRSIEAVNVAFGTRNLKDNMAQLFVTTELGGTPVATLDVSVDKALRFYSYPLQTPYVITGEEPELYIGYETEMTSSSYNVLTADYANEVEGCSFALNGGQWTDVYGYGTGSANIQAVLDADPGFSDAVMVRTQVGGYFKGGEQYAFPMRVMNFGTKPITAIDVEVSLGSSTETYRFDDFSIGQGQTVSLELPQFSAAESGNLDYSLKVVGVNGAEADPDPSDNELVTPIFFYAPDMERNILVEGFTGQACPNCPTGHVTLGNFLAKQATPTVEVMHHAGYYPDMFTMQEDADYLFFYEGTSTYAPAVMFNRTAAPLVTNAPVMDVSTAKMEKTFAYVEDCEPYASISLATSYDPATRQCRVKAGYLPHNAIPGGKAVINVMLVQDNMQAYQSNGGTNYNHTNVFRGCLTGNAWGFTAEFVPGEEVVWEHEFELPEKIHASYWNESNIVGSQYENSPQLLDQPVDPENMSVVAYIAAYDEKRNSGNRVFNCQRVKLGDSYTQRGYTVGIASPVADAPGKLRIVVQDGRVMVDGVADFVLTDMAGRRYSPAARLTAGVYVVVAEVGGRRISQKISVR